MPTFQVSTIIHRPVETIVAALMNADNHPYWTKHLERFEVLSGEAGKAGAVGRLHYLENGRRYVMEDRMLEAEPGSRYVSRVKGDVIEAIVETRLEPVADGIKITILWTGRGTRLPLNIMLPLMRRRMIRQSQEELETFRDLVETRGSDFSTATGD